MVDKYTGTGAAAGGGFTGGDPGGGIPASPWPAEHANLLTEELRNLVVTAGITPSYGDDTQVAQSVLALVQGAPARKSYLINGNFDVWQRGISFSVADVAKYTCDRWRVVADGPGGAGTMTVGLATISPGDPALPRGARFQAGIQVLVSSTAGVPTISQRVPQLEIFSNRPVCYSLYLRSLVPVAAVLKIVAVYDSGPAPEVVATKAISIGTSMERFEVAGLVPNVLGKASGVADYLDVVLELSPGPQVLFAACAQLEDGLVATEWQPRDLVLERVLCQRFYEQSYKEGTAPGTPTADGVVSTYKSGTNPSSSPTYGLDTRFRVPKRFAPAITWFDPFDGAVGKARNRTANIQVNVTATTSTSQERTGTPSLQMAEGDCAAHFTAEAEL